MASARLTVRSSRRTHWLRTQASASRRSRTRLGSTTAYCEESIMPGYILMHAEVTDPEEYEHFKVAAAKAIEDHRGRYLVRGGASTSLEGEFGSRVVLLEFPSYEDALAFYRSEAY